MLALLFDRLIPDAEAEETTLYPVIDRLLGTRTTTAVVRADHLEIARLARHVLRLRAALAEGAPDRDRATELRAVLYALHSVVLLHLDREDQVCLPVVDARLTPHQATRLVAAMRQATSEARAVPALL